MKDCLTKMLTHSRSMPLIMAFISASALSIALISQYVFGLAPCILCIIQRYPYGIIIALGILGFLLSYKSKKAVSAIMGLISISFIINSIIAFYHTGVEQKWWASHLEGCAVPDLGSDPSNILAALENAAPVRCDEIPWADPILGLSMANYNVIFCLGLGIIALISARFIWKNA